MNISNNSELMGTGKVSKVINSLAIPAIVGMLVNALYNFADTMFVSWIGTNAMSGAQIGFPIFMILTAFGQLYGVGGSSYISRLLGENDEKEANKTSTVTFLLTVISGVVISLVGLLFLKPILTMFGATANDFELAKSYTMILLLGNVFVMSNMTLNSLLRAEGNAMVSMYGLILGAVLNIVLDPIFIFVFDMGIAGAALATIIAQIVTTIYLFSYYLRGKTILKIKMKHFKPSKKIVSEIFKIGAPTLLTQLLSSITMGIMNKTAAGYGTEAVAAIGIVLKVFMLAFYALLGYTQGYLPVAGYNFGAKKYDRVQEATRVGIKVSSIYCGIVFLLFMFIPKLLVGIFKPEPIVLDLAIKTLRAWGLSLPMVGFCMIINMLFQAIGKAKESALLSVARQGFVLLPLLFILPNIFGLNGVIFAQPVSDILTFVLTVTLGVRAYKQIGRMHEEQLKKVA